jgi:uncharacterized membrane protein YgcG
MTSDVVKLITTAQEEVTHLLRLQQHPGPQQLQQSAASGQASQQQQQRLVDLSVQLLRWCLAAKWLWSAEQPSAQYSASFQLRAVEHAAALACQLDQHAEHFQCSVVLSVVARMLQKLDRLNSGDKSAVRVQLYNSPDFFKLSVLLLLLLAEAAAMNCSSSADSSSGATSGGGNGSGTSTSTSSSGGGSFGGTNSGSDGVGGSNGPQQLQQLSLAIGQMFFTCGCCHLPGWAVAARSLLDDDTFTSVICSPTDNGSSSGSSQAAFRKVPASSSSSSIQVFTVLAQVLTQCLCAWVGEPAGPEFGLDSWVVGGMHRLCTPLLMREQRQQQLLLLLQMVWRLPLVLLHVAQLYGGGHALVTSAAAEAAWCCCSCWLVLVKQPDDANVGRLSTKRLPQQWLQQLTLVLPLLQDCWLQLKQRQLLQGPDGGVLLRAAAAQQHCWQVRARIRLCSCYPLSQPPGGYDSSGFANITLDCGAAYSITTLLALLEPLTYFGPLSGVEGKLPAVLLLLEVLLRKLMLPIIVCNSSGSSSSSSRRSSAGNGFSSSSEHSVGAMFMCHHIFHALTVLTKDEGAGLGLLRDLLLQHQQQEWQVGQQQQHDLWRQFHAIIISIVKQATPAYFAGADHFASDEFVSLMDLAAKVAITTATAFPPGSSRAEVYAAFAPWLALFGQCLHLAGVHLASMQQTAADHAARARRGSSDQAAAADKKVGEAVADAHRNLTNLPQLLNRLEFMQGFWKGVNDGFDDTAPTSSHQLPPAAAAATVAAAAAATFGRVLCFMALLPDTAAQQPDAGCESSLRCKSSGVDFDVFDTKPVRMQSALAVALTEPAMCWQAAGGAPGEGLSMRHKEVQAVVGSELIQKLAAQLQLLGAQLCAKLAGPWRCNNLACINMAGASELQLVGGKGCMCGGCKVARYEQRGHVL